MRAGVMNHQQVTDLDFRQGAVDGELVVIFAQTADDVIDVVMRQAFLPADGDVVVRAVHRRAHEVRGAGIHADVVLVGVLLVNHARDKPAHVAGHPAAEFGFQRDAAVREDFLVYLADAFADGEYIRRGQFGRMITLKGNEIASAPLEEIAGKLKLVTEDNDLVVQGRRMGICFG